MRKKIVAGNWKMNHTAKEAYALVDELAKYAIDHELPADKEIVIAPPFPFLESIAGKLELVQSVKVAAQNCHTQSSGAYTGEVAAAMLGSIGIQYVILGHSERRAYFNETDTVVLEKLQIALANGLQPIFCCGETESERDSGNHKNFVEGQLEQSIFQLDSADFAKCVIAYEPVWAIGTGKTASPEQAQDIHNFIRFLIDQKFGPAVAADCTILYGGSCKPGNAADLFGNEDVDGGLIGGASLKAEDFIAIIEAL